MADDKAREREAARSIWRHRGRRMATGLNVLVSVGLAGMAILMANVLADRYGMRWNISGRDTYRLSDKTRGLIEGLDERVEVMAFFQRADALFDDVRNLLKEYDYEAAAAGPRRLFVEIVDTDRDIARTRDLAREFGVDRPNVVVFRCGGRRKIVESKDLADYHFSLESGRNVRKRLIGFKGEQVFSSAIQNVVQSSRPTVYFLSGHGERSIADFNPLDGFSGLATLMRRDNVEVLPLLLAETRRVPDNCSVLVVAAPTRAVADAERDAIDAYLARGGRVLAMLEPAIRSGLEPMLEHWGVRLADDEVVGLTLTGREVVVKDYPEHPVTHGVRSLITMFFRPRSVEPAWPAANTPADRPRVSVLAQTTEDSWAEMDPGQLPPRYDDGVDRRGPISLAVAVERGAAGVIDVQIKPAKMLVIGDADFVANGALEGGVGGNADFFMSGLNWLLEREGLMAISPKTPGELRIGLSREQWRLAYLLCLAGAPLALGLVGFLVWLARRR